MSKKLYRKNNTVRDKIIFLTGGTGSFGRFFTLEALKKGAKKIIVFSRDEDKQYSMQFEYRKFGNKLEFIIGDIRDKDSLMKSVHGAKIDIFIHAAAMKQIPSTEYNIIEAVKTNIIGAQNVVDVSIEEKIPKIIGITTDKVVEPVNAYGMTKALQEKIFVLGNKNAKEGKSKFSSVRYGNVVNSRGSVIQLFKKQLEVNSDLTLTNKDMTRFILTLRAASNLVFSAIEEMKGGEVFVPKIKPMKIIDLARVMVKEFKTEKSKIVDIGIRPGEKIHETLISSSEWNYTVDHGTFYSILPQINLKGVGFNYDVVTKKKAKVFKYSSDQPPFLSKKEIKKILKSEKII